MRTHQSICTQQHVRLHAQSLQVRTQQSMHTQQHVHSYTQRACRCTHSRACTHSSVCAHTRTEGLQVCLVQNASHPVGAPNSTPLVPTAPLHRCKTPCMEDVALMCLQMRPHTCRQRMHAWVLAGGYQRACAAFVRCQLCGEHHMSHDACERGTRVGGAGGQRFCNCNAVFFA